MAFVCDLSKIFFIAIVSSNCHEALKKFINLLRDEQFETIVDQGQFSKLENILKDIESVGPFTGCGFFNVEKKTVTSIIGYTVTYLIILIEFKTS